MPIDLDIEKNATKLCEYWRAKGVDANTLVDLKDAKRYVEACFPELKGWTKDIFAAMLRQGIFSSVSISREVGLAKKVKFVTDYFDILHRKLVKIGIDPKLVFKPVEKQTLPAHERQSHGKAPIYELSREFEYVLIGRLVPLATRLGAGATLASKLLAALELRVGGFIGPLKEGLSGRIELMGESLILGTWFHLIERTERIICIILRKGSIFKEHPILFDLFASAIERGVQMKVVITKEADQKVIEGFRKIGARIIFVTTENLEEKGFEMIRIAIHDDEHVIHLEKFPGTERKIFYFRLKPNVAPLSDYIKRFEELEELSKKTR